MQRSIAFAFLVCVGSLGCLQSPPDALLICHNANCADPGTADGDDTLDALSASLALRIDGRPVLDGVELDTVWEATTGRCVFAHGALPDAPDVRVAIDLVAAHVSRAEEPSWNGRRFVVKLELKPDEATDPVRHAECMLDQLDSLEAAARTGHHPLTVIFDSADAELLRAITERPRWRGKREGELLEVKLESGFDSAVPQGLEIDILTVRWAEIDSSLRHEFDARGKVALAWGRDPGPETLGKLVELSPRYIGTNDALLLRRWLSGR